jgi:hypothetical protein
VGRLRQEDSELEDCVDYISRTCLNRKEKEKRKEGKKEEREVGRKEGRKEDR